MFAKKNFSPQQVGFVTALPISGVAAISFYLYTEKWLPALLLFIGFFIINYLIISLSVKRFVYRKIKLIYKLIYQTKASKKEEFYFKNILPQKSIDEVNEDVEQWAVQHKEELEV
ncbi:MAG TPA: sensor histidine kinase, partial [Hanamia sp.]|nr:sensor histidine kinase [Hanamia sp.]